MRRAVHAAHVAAVIVGGFVMGKACQYAAVDALAERIGFDLASLVGVAPFVAVLVWAKHRCPAVLGYRIDRRPAHATIIHMVGEGR